MTAMSVQPLRRRPFALDGNAALCSSGDWCDGKPLSTQLLNAYTLLIPEGERFVIRTCAPYLREAAPGLREELRRLFFQEGGHSREHERVLKAMRADGQSLDLFRKPLEWMFYRVIEPCSPGKLRLATAAAIEHHNAVIATHFLNRALLRGIRIGELRRLFLWHFAEEIEHKETAFKLLQSVSRNWLLRALGLALSFGTFMLALALGTILLAVKTGSAFSAGFWSEFMTHCRGCGLLATIVRESARYLSPGFAPSPQESRTLLDAALAELESLGVVRPPFREIPSRRTLPAAFRDRMAPSLERVRRLRPRNSYFGACIGGYDGAWVQSQGMRKLNFCTYSYLGLVGHPCIDEAAKAAIDRYGTGTHGVRLLGGNLELHEALESRIAACFEREAAITFSSGYVTNVSAIAALVGKGDHVLSDKRNHASIVDGCRLSEADVTRFRHNDMADLERRLSRLPDESRKLILVDAVYSMDGDAAPLQALTALRDRYPNTLLMVDEAHSLGVLGCRGRGIEEHFGCSGQIDVLMGTLSKTIPAQGGYIAGSRELIAFLRFNARGFVFSAALPPPIAAAALAALDLIESEGPARRARLMSSVDYFVGRLRDASFDVGNTASAIVPVLLGSESLAFDMARRCNALGLYTMPVAYPAVPKGEERLRLNVTYAHSREDLDTAVETLRMARDYL